MRVVVCILVLALAALSAPQASPSKTPAKPAAAKAAPAKPVRSDAEIEAEIKARLARSKAAADNFQVKVRGGVATFEGTTSVIQRKGSATRMAKSAGARAVQNNIKISEGARKAAAEKLAKRRVTVTRNER